MANARRGEIAAELGGVPRRLVLTLGALAELEAHFEAGDLVELAERFGSGRLAAADLAAILGAGLRGAGETITDREVAGLAVEGGAAGYARIVTELLTVTFGAADGGATAPVGTAPATSRARPLPLPPGLSPAAAPGGGEPSAPAAEAAAGEASVPFLPTPHPFPGTT